MLPLHCAMSGGWVQVTQKQQEATLQEKKQKLEDANEKIEADVIRFKERERREEERRVLSIKAAYMRAEEGDKILQEEKEKVNEAQRVWKEANEELKKSGKPIEDKKNESNKTKKKRDDKLKHLKAGNDKLKVAERDFDKVESEINSLAAQKRDVENEAKVRAIHAGEAILSLTGFSVILRKSNRTS